MSPNKPSKAASYTAPSTTKQGRFLYRTIYNKAGTLLRSLIKNHPFLDGNKRMALTATEVFLLINGYALYATQEERVNFALYVAASEPDVHWQEVARWIRRHCIRLDALIHQLETGTVDRRILRGLRRSRVLTLKGALEKELSNLTQR